MYRRNYKVYVDIGPDLTTLSNSLAIIYTGTGPSFVRSDLVGPTLVDLIKLSALPDICYANNNSYLRKGTVNVPIRQRQCLIKIRLRVCEKL